MSRSRRRDEFDFDVFRRNLQTIRQNLRDAFPGFRGRLQILRFREEEPIGVAHEERPRPKYRMEKEELYDGRIVKRYYDEKGSLVKEETTHQPSLDAEPEPEPSEEASHQQTYKGVRPLTIIDRLRSVFQESAEQVKLKTGKERLRLKLLEKQIEEAKRPKEEERTGRFY